ncbi:MAG: hypothetical protein CMJ95_12785 [Planctomycetes bacterium]|nr:hypothetical protein [Planctomycetota bacterium]
MAAAAACVVVPVRRGQVQRLHVQVSVLVAVRGGVIVVIYPAQRRRAFQVVLLLPLLLAARPRPGLGSFLIILVTAHFPL